MNHAEYMRAIINELFSVNKTTVLSEVITPKQALSFIDREQTQEVMSPGDVKSQFADRKVRNQSAINALADRVAKRIDYAISHECKTCSKRHENDTIIISMAVYIGHRRISIGDDVLSDKFVGLTGIDGGDVPTEEDVMQAAMDIYKQAGWQVKLEPGRQTGEYGLYLEAKA